MVRLPETPKSYWMDSVVLPKFPRLDKDIHVDVVIVGGGITGLTSTYLLVNEGLKVAVIEADRLLNGNDRPHDRKGHCPAWFNIR